MLLAASRNWRMRRINVTKIDHHWTDCLTTAARNNLTTIAALRENILGSMMFLPASMLQDSSINVAEIQYVAGTELACWLDTIEDLMLSANENKPQHAHFAIRFHLELDESVLEQCSYVACSVRQDSITRTVFVVCKAWYGLPPTVKNTNRS